MMDLDLADRASAWDLSEQDLTEAQLQYTGVTVPMNGGSTFPKRGFTMSETTTTSATEAGTTAVATPVATAPATPVKTYTQEELDATVTERVNKKYKEFETIKATASEVESLKTENTSFKSQITELESNFALASKDAQILKVALDKGVPGDLLERLKGNTPEEIAADADVLLKQFGGGKKDFSGFNGGTGVGAQVLTPGNPDAGIRKAAGY